MKQYAISVILVAIFLLAGCGNNAGGSAIVNDGKTLAMDTGNFTGSTALTVSVGTTVKLIDAQDGAAHLLTTGEDGVFQVEAGAPKELSSASGITITPGQTVNITFTTAGKYKITCIIHPSMNATVTVK